MDESVGPESHRVPLPNGGALRVVAWPARNPVEAPPLVLLHGFMGSVEAWGDLPSRLADDRTVVAVDLPGHGESHAPATASSYAVGAMAAAVGAAVRGVIHGPVDWLGYSMGGRVLLAGVCERLLNARRLIVESGSPGIEEPESRRERVSVDDERARALETLGLEAFVDRWMAMPLFASQQRLGPDVRRRERERRLVHDAAALAACLRGASVARQPSYWGRLEPLRHRLLVLTGGLDTRFAELGDAMVDRCPGARRHGVPDVGHAVHLEAPDAWLAAVRGHLADAGADG